MNCLSKYLSLRRPALIFVHQRGYTLLCLSLLTKESMSVTPLELKQEVLTNLLPLIRQLVVDSAYQMSFTGLFPNFNTQSF